MADPSPMRRRATAYVSSDDPLTRASNILAMALALNQPFYPIYVHAFVGDVGYTWALTFLSTPFFLAAPIVARRLTTGGRLYFPAIGAINTFFCAFVFGEGSGVELFLAPCAVIAAMSARAHERLALGAFLCAVFAVFSVLRGNYGTPLHAFTPEQYAHFLSLNVFSAAALVALAAWTFSSAWATIEREARS